MDHRRATPLLGLLALLAALLGAAPTAWAEIAPLSRDQLRTQAKAIVVGTCVKVESTTSTANGMETTRWLHHLSIERVESDPSGSLRVGSTIVVASWSSAWRGAGSPPPYGTGHSNRPAQGERRRLHCAVLPSADATVRAEPLLPNGWQPTGPAVVLVGADDEYRSEITMPLIAACLRADAAVTTDLAFAAQPGSDTPDPDCRTHIVGHAALDRADVGVFYMRWREPDAPTLRALEGYFGSGRPIVGLRTSTHMLRAPALADGSEAPMNNDWPTRIFGQRWISHHGHDSRTRVLAPPESARTHPILRGFSGDFVVRSWLYDVEPLPKDCVVLLWGEVVKDGESSPTRQPILWVRERGPETPTPFPTGGTPARRMAFTTLGHPADFESREIRRLVEQMILWAAGQESAIPEGGVAAMPPEPYVAPPTR